MRDNYYRYYASVRDATDDTRAYIEVLLHDACSYCGRGASHVDHIEPRSLGGAHDWTNLTSACASCNPSKSSKRLLEWLAIRYVVPHTSPAVPAFRNAQSNVAASETRPSMPE